MKNVITFEKYLARIVFAMSGNDQVALNVIESDALYDYFYKDKLTYKELCLIRNFIAYAKE